MSRPNILRATALVAAGWTLLVALSWLAAPPGVWIGLLHLAAIVMPLAGVAMAGWIALRLTALERAVARVGEAMETLSLPPVGALPPPEASAPVMARLDRIAALAARTEETLAAMAVAATPVSRPAKPAEGQRAAPRGQATARPAEPASPPRPREDQPRLALGPAAAASGPLETDDLIRALDFPEHEGDADGFAALRRALRDPVAGRLVKASQDVLTLLSQDGIYMDDLVPDRARPELWRRFARGERGRAMAALGGIRDRSSLALSAGRMREDVIFRDAAHHFLRLFDRTLLAIEPRCTDTELARLSDTRTARAFMLLGRVNGAFD